MSHGARFEALVKEAKRRIQEISPQDAAQLQLQGALLIDVRETAEFDQKHAIGAVHLSKGILELKIEQHVPDSSATIICYCGGGSRSALAAENLQRMGYSKVFSMSGGFKGWQENQRDC